MDQEDYEEQCLQNRARFQALLKEMGYDGDLLPPTKKASQTPRATRKRKASVDTEDGSDGNEENHKKIARVGDYESGKEGTGLRRSRRNQGKKVDYTGDSIGRPVPRLTSYGVGMKMKSEPRSVGKRLYDPKTFGTIPGIPVGTWWQTREECSADAVHAPWVAGISGGPKGAYSVALSGGYEDDVDLGDAFTFTGSGGRDLKGTKASPKNLRTAPQSCDQLFENPFNSALKKSCETKKPIRVIRGYKLNSPYAPAQGYRYDGLYTVEKAWMERGLNTRGWMVCKFAFKRIEGQAPLQLNDGDDMSESELIEQDAKES
ncbi:hypothetical protein AcW1_000586 [Taiwanofungus camphoratus]|nr:hypothetical protein AcW2_000920 [Antrodia cinnamomea]KAI0936315.1 hypothetical protein AcV5_004485 [Antrodia cinnamomea]KAI0961525.1 hypothetical protein AcV7_000605 [Antrodia cinnamomea]KAI0963538.1 hypothetical protein AcW1_000586 [Antrodia cinnamomea]